MPYSPVKFTGGFQIVLCAVCMGMCIFSLFVSSRVLLAPNPLKQADAASKSVKKEKDKLKEDRLAQSHS